MRAKLQNTFDWENPTSLLDQVMCSASSKSITENLMEQRLFSRIIRTSTDVKSEGKKKNKDVTGLELSERAKLAYRPQDLGVTPRMSVGRNADHPLELSLLRCFSTSVDSSK